MSCPCLPPHPNSLHCACCYAIIRLYLYSKGVSADVCYGNAQHPPHLPPLRPEAGAAGCGGRYGGGPAPVVLRREPSGREAGGGAEPRDGEKGPSAGQVGRLSAAGAGCSQSRRAACDVSGRRAGQLHPRRPEHRHRHRAGEHHPRRMGQGRGQLHHGRHQQACPERAAGHRRAGQADVHGSSWLPHSRRQDRTDDGENRHQVLPR